MENLNKKNSRGFVRLIVIIIIILVVISLLGINVDTIWQNFFLPVFAFIASLILSVVNFISSLIKYILTLI